MVNYGENVRDEIIAVGTSNVLVSNAKYRNELIITNSSGAAQTITLSFGKPAVANAGIPLKPNSVYYASNAQGFNVYQGEIYSVGDAVSGQLSIFER